MRTDVGLGMLLLLMGSSLFAFGVVALSEALRWLFGTRVIWRTVTIQAPPETVVVYKTLPEDTSGYVTLVETMTRLGICPHKDLTWALGRRAAARHLDVYGVPPKKVDRTKTSGSGTHSFAGYPPEFLPELEAIIGKARVAA